MPLKALSFTLFCVSTVSLFAQNNVREPKSYIDYRDTVFMELVGHRKYLHHEVKGGHTLFSIASYYGLSLDVLYAENPALQQDSVLRIGLDLRIPLPNQAIVRYPGEKFDKKKHAPLFYRVQAGDNLYAISRRHFEMPVDSVMKRNRLTVYNLQPGQVLHLGWIGAHAIPPEWQTRNNTPRGQLVQKYEADKGTLQEYAGHGVCFWQKELNEEKQFYALHRSAAIGTVMWVENPMSHRKTPVKVIGRIPAGFDPNIEVIVSPAAARYLGAIDARFFVKTTYLK